MRAQIAYALTDAAYLSRDLCAVFNWHICCKWESKDFDSNMIGKIKGINRTQELMILKNY